MDQVVKPISVSQTLNDNVVHGSAHWQSFFILNWTERLNHLFCSYFVWKSSFCLPFVASSENVLNSKNLILVIVLKIIAKSSLETPLHGISLLKMTEMLNLIIFFAWKHPIFSIFSHWKQKVALWPCQYDPAPRSCSYAPIPALKLMKYWESDNNCKKICKMCIVTSRREREREKNIICNIAEKTFITCNL